MDLEPGDDHVGVDRVAGCGREGLGGDAGARRHPLHEGVHGRRQEARAVLRGARTGEPRERRHPLRGDGRIRRDPVVGLAIPGRKGQDLDLGRDESERVLQRLLPLPVAGDMDEDGGALDVPESPRARSATASASKPSGTLDSVRLWPFLRASRARTRAAFMIVVGIGVAETRAGGPGSPKGRADAAGLRRGSAPSGSEKSSGGGKPACRNSPASRPRR